VSPTLTRGTMRRKDARFYGVLAQWLRQHAFNVKITSSTLVYPTSLYRGAFYGEYSVKVTRGIVAPSFRVRPPVFTPAAHAASGKTVIAGSED